MGRRSAAFFKRCENQDAILYVPAAVVWECSLLARAGRIVLYRSVRSFFEDLFSNPAYQPFDTSAEQVLLADEIGFNRDPFDGLIVAAARTLDLHLITRDDDIVESRKVKTLW